MPHDDDTARPVPTPPPMAPPHLDTGGDADDVASTDRTAGDDDTALPDDDAASKAAERKWETRSKQNHRKLIAEQRRAAELQTKLDQLLDGTRSDTERAVEAARREERDKFTSHLRAQKLDNAVLRYAGSRLADPDDALRLLQLEPADVVADDGSVDDDAIRAAVDDLIRTKPYLVAASRRAGPAPVPGDQGTRPRPPDEDLSKVPMTEYMRRKHPAQYHPEA